MTANDNNELGIPNPYYIPYGCYSWEMVNKLDEIVQRYDLKLLSSDVGCQSYESSVLFSSLGIDGVFHGDVEYLAGYFYPEGTFNIALLFQPDTDQWPYEDNLAEYYYSVKEYFDPVYYEVADLENCTQWNYTRSDGRTVLLVMNDEWARIHCRPSGRPCHRVLRFVQMGRRNQGADDAERAGTDLGTV